MSENRWISMKIYGHLWKCLNIAEHLWKSLNITENVWELLWTSMKISCHLGKSLNITENFWKLLFHLWNGLKTSVGALHSWLVFDLCYVNFVWTTFKKNTKEKQNKLIIGTKQTNFRQKSITELHFIYFRSCDTTPDLKYQKVITPKNASNIKRILYKSHLGIAPKTECTEIPEELGMTL